MKLLTLRGALVLLAVIVAEIAVVGGLVNALQRETPWYWGVPLLFLSLAVGTGIVMCAHEYYWRNRKEDA